MGVNPKRSRIVKNTIANKAKTNVYKRICKNKMSKGKVARKSIKNNLTFLAESRQCAIRHKPIQIF